MPLGLVPRDAAFRMNEMNRSAISFAALWLTALGLLSLLGTMVAAPSAACGQQASGLLPVTVEIGDSKAVVQAAGELFAEYDFTSYARPILYPLLGPGQVSLVRHWPMRADVAGEAHDHPHHKSLWFAHGDVNGLDFWSEKARIKNLRIGLASTESEEWPGLIAVNQWMGTEGVVCNESATLRFAAMEHTRFIDCRYQLTSEQEVVFGDTKEGTFALRTHPALNLTSTSDGPPPGHAENSEGDRDQAIWGKPARWVAYFGTIDGQPYGLAILDHPGNLRHPTTWHARDYGLVAANPFGLHDFLQRPRGAGDFRLKPGEALTLRYRVILFRGPYHRENIVGWFDQFAR